MKSKRKLAKELLKIVKNNGLYDPFDYDWDWNRNEDIEVVSEKEVINALIDNLTKNEIKALQHKDTEIRIFGTYEALLCVTNLTLDVNIHLIYIGKMPYADAPL